MVRKLSLLLCGLLALASLQAELVESDVDLRSLIKGATTRGGQQVRTLNFQGIFGNFLVFYDYKGDLLYLQFKRDKWDYSLDKRVAFLQAGVTYEVAFDFFGKILKKPGRYAVDVKSKVADLNKVSRDPFAVRNLRELFLGKFLTFRPVVLDHLRF